MAYHHQKANSWSANAGTSFGKYSATPTQRSVAKNFCIMEAAKWLDFTGTLSAQNNTSMRIFYCLITGCLIATELSLRMLRPYFSSYRRSFIATAVSSLRLYTSCSFLSSDLEHRSSAHLWWLSWCCRTCVLRGCLWAFLMLLGRKRRQRKTILPTKVIRVGQFSFSRSCSSTAQSRSARRCGILSSTPFVED